MDQSAFDAPIRTPSDVLQLWTRLMGRAGFSLRTLWLAFLDEDGFLQPVLVPIEDAPEEPEDEVLHALAGIVDDLRAEQGFAGVLLLLSRPGDHAMTPSDRRWARALTASIAAVHGGWPVHLATADHVRVFAADDLITVP